MNESVLTMSDVLGLSAVLDIVAKGKRIKWAIDGDVERLATGVARHIVVGPDNFAFLGRNDDVRQGFVRISGTVEHTLPVMQMVEMIAQGLLVSET